MQKGEASCETKEGSQVILLRKNDPDAFSVVSLPHCALCFVSSALKGSNEGGKEKRSGHEPLLVTSFIALCLHRSTTEQQRI
jgi:hypothetical protein